MRKFYLFLGKFFTVIFAIFFVITSTVVLIQYGPVRLLSHSSLYKTALSDLDVYKKIPATTSNFLPSHILLDPCTDYQENCGHTPAGTALPSYSIALSPENWKAFLEIFLPPAEIQAMTESAIENLFVFLDGNVDQISIPLDMLKGNLTGVAGEQDLYRFFNALPPCNDVETSQLSVPNLTSVTVPLCNPADELLTLLIPNLRQQIEPYINTIPDGINISLPSTTLADIRLDLGLMNWIPLLPLLFLLGITLLGVRSLKKGLRLGGILLLISSLLALGVGLTIRFEAKTALDLILGFQNTAILTPELISLLHQLGEYLLYHLTDWIIYPALVLFLIGLVAWIISALIRKKASGSVLLPTDIPLEVS